MGEVEIDLRFPRSDFGTFDLLDSPVQKFADVLPLLQQILFILDRFRLKFENGYDLKWLVGEVELSLLDHDVDEGLGPKSNLGGGQVGWVATTLTLMVWDFSGWMG